MQHPPFYSGNRVVVTGLGALSPVGLSMEASWQNLIEGKTGITRVTKIDPDRFTCKVAGEIRDFDPTPYMDPKEIRRSDPFTHFAVAASQMAYEDAGLSKSSVTPERLGVIIGSGIGGVQTIEKQSLILHTDGPRRVSPFMIPSLISDIAAGMVAIKLNAKGPNFSSVSACASGAHAIGEAYHFLKLGKADVMLAGGSESAINPFGVAGFCSMKAMSTGFNDEPERASRPFDAKRDGFVMGEGAGVLVLETLEHAQARGAKIYCELVGYAASCDAYHITSPCLDGETLAVALRQALAEAGVAAEDVDYINAHGTSTQYNDKCETNAYKKALGKQAYEVSISSTKSMTGHMLGAAGGFEAAVCAKVIQTGKIPPTINYEYSDPECDLCYTPNKAVERDVKVAISDNLGFGGHNAVLVFKAFDA